MLSCLDCQHCKIDLKHHLLRCKKRRWLMEKGGEKTVTLSRHSDISKRELHINHRVIFEVAEMCERTGDYEGMDE